MLSPRFSIEDNSGSERFSIEYLQQILVTSVAEGEEKRNNPEEQTSDGVLHSAKRYAANFAAGRYTTFDEPGNLETWKYRGPRTS